MGCGGGGQHELDVLGVGKGDPVHSCERCAHGVGVRSEVHIQERGTAEVEGDIAEGEGLLHFLSSRSEAWSRRCKADGGPGRGV